MSVLRKCIDSHVHLWNVNDFKYAWTPDMKINKDYTIDDYKADRERLLKERNLQIDGFVYVQVLNIEEETRKIINLSKQDPLVKGIVGWVDLLSENVDVNVKRLKNESNGRLVGIRHLIQDEVPNWIVAPKTKNGLKAVFENDLAYDLQFRPNLIKHALELTNEFPNMRFIIDHIGKPHMFSNPFDAKWAEDIKSVSKYENIYCKLSGLVPESSSAWSFEEIKPHVLHVLDCFGWERCMFGCDWPIFELAPNCDVINVYDIVNKIVTEKYQNEKNFDEIINAIFYENVIKAYKLKF